MSDPIALSPLGARRSEPAPERRFAPGLVLRELPFVAKLSLRGDARDPAFASGVERALGMKLPSGVGDVAEGACTIFALAPDEWLVVAAGGDAASMASKLESELVGMHAAVVDVSSATTIVEVSGACGSDLIAKGSSVDLCGTAAAPARCWQTRLARIPVLIYAPSSTGRYELFIPRSLAASAWAWLADAAAFQQDGEATSLCN